MTWEKTIGNLCRNTQGVESESTCEYKPARGLKKNRIRQHDKARDPMRNIKLVTGYMNSGESVA